MSKYQYSVCLCNARPLSRHKEPLSYKEELSINLVHAQVQGVMQLAEPTKLGGAWSIAGA